MLKCCLFFTISYKFTSFSKIFQLPRPRAPLCDASCARARSSPRLPATHSRCTPRFSPPFNALPPGRPSVAQSAEVRNAVPPRSALPGLSVAHPSTRLLTHFHPNGLLWHISRKCVTPPAARFSPPFNALPPGRPSVAHFPEVRSASPPRTCLPGPLQGRIPPSHLLTHFHPNGFLWHFLRKCVTPPAAKPASRALRGTFLLPSSNALPPKRPSVAHFPEVRNAVPSRSGIQVPLGHLSEQKRSKTYSWLPLRAPGRTIMPKNVLLAALEGTCAHFQRTCLPRISSRGSCALARTSKTRSSPPGPSKAHSFSHPLTHFGPNGLLWLISRKCVTLPVAEPAFQAPLGRIPPPSLQRTSVKTAFCGTFRGSA